MPTRGEPQVPTRLLLNESVYRTLPGGREHRIGVGLVLKSGKRVDFPMHQPSGYSAVWCLRGTGTYHADDGTVLRLAPGSLFHRFTDRPHENRIDSGSHWAEAWIVVPTPIEQSLLTTGALDPRRPVQHPGIDLGLVAELADLVDIIRAAPESDLPRTLARLIDLLLALSTRDTARSDPQRIRLDTACRRLGEDPRCDLGRLASDLGLSYERFRKLFRDHLGVSPGEYRIRRRIDRARTLLQTSDQPIKAIASTLGYPNPFAFSAQFKQVVGESPESYRQRH